MASRYRNGISPAGAKLGDPGPVETVAFIGLNWADKIRESAVEQALNWLEYRGNDKREYKNALALVLPSPSQLDKARKELQD